MEPNGNPKRQGSLHPDLRAEMTDRQNSEPSLLEILAYYAEAGFSADAYAADGGRVLCGTCQSSITPDHLDVHSIRRLEGASDPSDMVGVIAIICPVCDAHATAVLKYGPEASPDEIEIWQRTNDLRHSEILGGHMAPGEDDPEVIASVPDPQGRGVSGWSAVGSA